MEVALSYISISQLHVSNFCLLVGLIEQHAYGYVNGGKYYGTNLNLDVWNPYVEGPDEFSSSQLWLVGNPTGDSDIIEAGWHVCYRFNLS